MKRKLNSVWIGTGLAAIALAGATSVSAQQAQETPLSMVNALHTAFGEHHARAVHTKGVVLEGTFTPAAEAKAIVKTPIFTGGTRPVIFRFSDFAGVPDLPDNDDGASPAGLGIKIKAADGDDFDIEANQHRDFITATFDEFAIFLRAVGAAGKGDTAPLGAFLASHPHARQFLASRTYPVSFAEAKYFGVNSEKFTNAAGRSLYIRYQFVPRAGEQYLTPDARKAKSANYLQDEVVERLGHAPIVFDWYAQIAEKGDAIADPSTAWPDTRRLVKLGTFTITRQPADSAGVARTLLFLPGQPHPGVEPADPMLVMRNTAYPISLGQRQ